MDVVTLDQIITTAKLHADMVNSDFMNQDEWTIMVNDAVRQYWDLIVQLTQDYYFKQSYFQTNPNQLAYPLPDDLYNLRGVDVLYSTGPTNDFTNAQVLWVALMPYMFSERNARNFLYYQAVTPPYYSRYRIQGDTIMFEPLTATASNTVRLSYILKPPRLAEPADTINVIAGYDQYIAKVAAMHAHARQENFDSVQFLAADLQRFESEIKQLANDRNRDTADRVQDVYAKQTNVWGY